MNISTINQFIDLLQWALDELSVEVPLPRLERLAILLHHSMDGGRRLYHTSAHAFMVADSMRPHQTLAALFHDVVCVQVDGGLPERAEDTIMRSMEAQDGDLAIIPDVDSEDWPLRLCLGVFGYRPGEVPPPSGGLNEFLSALVALRELEPYLSIPDLVTIAACIEGTIPFRKSDSDGRQPFDKLEERIQALNQQSALGLEQADIEDMVTQAVIMANRDVAGFAITDPRVFLSDTWILLPETNTALWSVGRYSIIDYRQALLNMERFFGWLDPQGVFHCYRETPPDADFQAMRHQAEVNIHLARNYLGVKLVTTGILEALAASSGGDAPISMFLGDIKPSDPDTSQTAGDFLPKDIPSSGLVYDEALLSCLEAGRAFETEFDMTTSPISTFVYRSLGPENTDRCLEDARALFTGEMTSEEFLGRCDPGVISAIAAACANITISRREALLALAGRLV